MGFLPRLEQFRAPKALFLVPVLLGNTVACHRSRPPLSTTTPTPTPDPTPTLTGFAPLQGPPGTEVTLSGTGLGTATQVAYAGAILPPGSFEAEDGRIRVRVPDDASSGGVFTVTLPGGPLATALPFALVPSRLATYGSPLAKDTAGTWDPFPTLDFPVRQRSDVYPMAGLPKAPIFHPYNISQPVPGIPFTETRGVGLRFSLCFQLPAPFREALPQAVKDVLATEGVDPGKVEILCVAQNYPYDGVTGVDGTYLFRPQYWADPSAPTGLAGYNHVFNMRIALIDADPGITLNALANGTVQTTSISVHDAGGSNVSSSNTDPIAGLDVNATTAFWSFSKVVDATFAPPAGSPATPDGRVAVTLHLLLNDADQAAMDLLAASATTMADLFEALASSPSFAGSRAFRQIQALIRPLFQVASQEPSTSQDTKAVTLVGTGLKGATRVTLDGADVPSFQALSDATLRVILPKTATGALRVTTPLAESAPVAVPAA